MARPKAEVAARLPIRRGLGEAEAALYVGLGATKFRELVADGRMPRPRLIDGSRVWDIHMLDAAFAALPLDGVAANVAGSGGNPWHE